MLWSWWERARAKVRPGKQLSISARFRPTLEPLEDRTLLSAPALWTPTGPGGGGSLFAPSLSPSSAGTMFIASDMGEVFHSASAGQSWDTIDFRQLQGAPSSLVQFTSNPSVLFTIDNSANSSVPSRSSDGGVTWHDLANDPTGGGAYTLLADPNSAGRLLLTDFGNLYFSNDGGTTWATKYSTSDSNNGLLLAGAFFDGSNIYAGTSKGLLVSTNGGASFSVSAAAGMPATEAILSFAGAKQNGLTRLFATTKDSGSVYAGIGGGDYWGGANVYSMDVGHGGWVLKETGIDSSAFPFFVSMAGNNINTAYLAGGSSNGTPTVYKTTNGGASWQSVFQTTTNTNIRTDWEGAGGDQGWWYGETMMGFEVAPNDPNRIVATDLGFAYLSTDGGATWSALNSSPTDLHALGAATPVGALYQSSGLDNTSVWGVNWVDATHMIAADTDIQGSISSNAGVTWSFGTTGLTYNTMYRSVTSPSGMVYAAESSVHDLYQETRLDDASINSGTGAVVFSADKGVTWKTLHDFKHPVVWVATDPTNPHRLYASVVGSSSVGGIYVTNDVQDGAASVWTKLAAPPRTQGHPFNIQVLKDGILVVSYSGRLNASGAFTASSGVFVSGDGGKTWSDRSAAGMKYWTQDVVIDPSDASQNTWYAGVYSGWGGAANGLGGLYMTTNRGMTWTRILTLDRVTSATINPTNPNEMYVTSDQGLWYTSNRKVATPTFTQLTAYPFRQPERVFFNPYNLSQIWVTSFGNGMRVGVVSGAAPLASSGASLAAPSSVATPTLAVSSPIDGTPVATTNSAPTVPTVSAQAHISAPTSPSGTTGSVASGAPAPNSAALWNWIDWWFTSTAGRH